MLLVNAGANSGAVQCLRWVWRGGGWKGVVL